MTAPETYQATLEDLLAREAIRDCIYRYSHGIDRRDRETLRLCYWPDATDDHVSFSGNAYEFIDVIMPFLEGLKASTHSMSNILIRVDGDTARVETYWHVFHREAGADGAADYDYIAGGRYLDTFERRDGEWRVLTRVLIRDWYQVIHGTGDWAQYLRSPEGPHGSQKETDPVRKLFGTLGGAVTPATAPA
jgi:hypothetical protein